MPDETPLQAWIATEAVQEELAMLRRYDEREMLRILCVLLSDVYDLLETMVAVEEPDDDDPKEPWQV